MYKRQNPLLFICFVQSFDLETWFWVLETKPIGQKTPVIPFSPASLASAIKFDAYFHTAWRKFFFSFHKTPSASHHPLAKKPDHSDLFTFDLKAKVCHDKFKGERRGG